MVLFFNLDYKSTTKSAKSNPFPNPFILKEVHEDENGSREEAGEYLKQLKQRKSVILPAKHTL